MASEVFFTTNAGDYDDLEGLYINEKDPPGFIRGVDLNVVGMVGKCVRGPTASFVEITSPQRFLEVFGGRDYSDGGTLQGEIWAALLNKPFGKIVVRRVVAAAAAAATVNLDDTAGAGGTNIVQIDASSVGAWPNGRMTYSVEDASDDDANHWNLRVEYRGIEQLYENLDTQAGQNNLAAVIGDDPANLIVVTKLADGRPHNQTDTACGTGSDGSVAASDYTTAITAMAAREGVSVVLIPEAPPTPSTVNGTIVTLAAAATDRIFLTWSGVHGQSVSTEATAVGTQITTRSDRILWCYNSAKTRDTVAGVLIDQGPHVWLASIISQTDVDVHKGAHETAKYLAGIASLRNEALSREDLKTLRAAGITTLEKLPGEFLFRSVVTTSLVSGKTELSRRLMADFFLLSVADRLKYYVKKKNTRETRASMIGEMVDFATTLQRQGRVVAEDDDELGPAIKVESVSTSKERAQGIEKVLTQIRFISHILGLVLEADLGTGVVIEK